ncbi:hypothetical protein DL98DRAFT_512939 [Cadophora sp. DSE1049]|nr:hypothetical protein DL98DRAFT_512939 [Cadophora sp. DSE1049]
MSSQTTDIITVIIAFASLGLSVAGVIIAYHSLKALSSKSINTSTILPLHRIPPRPYHPYTTGYIHFLRDPYLRPLVQAACRPYHRVLDVDGEEGVEGRCMELTPLRMGGKAIQITSSAGDDKIGGSWQST